MENSSEGRIGNCPACIFIKVSRLANSIPPRLQAELTPAVNALGLVLMIITILAL